MKTGNLVIGLLISLLAVTSVSAQKGKLAILKPSAPGNQSDAIPIDKRLYQKLIKNQIKPNDLVINATHLGIIDSITYVDDYNVNWGILYGDVSGNWTGGSAGHSNVAAAIEIAKILRDDDGKWIVPLKILISGEGFSGSFKLINNNSNFQFSQMSRAESSARDVLIFSSNTEQEIHFAFASSQSLNNQAILLYAHFEQLRPGITLNYSDLKFSELIIDDKPVITTSVKHQSGEIPAEWKLSQNYPNPFNSVTMVEYQLPKKSSVVIEVLNLLGQRIQTLVDENKAAGIYQVRWNGRDLNGQPVGSGIYLLKMQTSQFSKIRKMIYIR